MSCLLWLGKGEGEGIENSECHTDSLLWHRGTLLVRTCQRTGMHVQYRTALVL